MNRLSKTSVAPSVGRSRFIGAGLRGRAFGFSLVEIMVAIGVLGIGMIMVAASFPVGMDQHRRTTEKTLARTIAANAKMILALENTTPPLAGANYQPFDLHNARQPDGTSEVNSNNYNVNFGQRVYPPVSTAAEAAQSRYSWCALGKTGPGQNFQDVILFVCKKVDKTALFTVSFGNLSQPVPVSVTVTGVVADSTTVTVNAAGDHALLFAQGYLVDATYGEIYRILSLGNVGDLHNVTLNRKVEDRTPPIFTDNGFVVPPLVGISDQPVIDVYKFTLAYE